MDKPGYPQSDLDSPPGVPGNRLGKTDIQVENIGTLAVDLLSTGQVAAVFGVISRGIFVKFENDKMIFLSFENHRGPLTVNLPGGTRLLTSCSIGETIIISREGILFPASGIGISISNANVWYPTLGIETPIHRDDRVTLIRQLILDVYQREMTIGFGELLPNLVGLYPEYRDENDLLRGISKRIGDIREQLARGDLISLFQSIQPLFGLGDGLTPGGDDFVIGLLLSLNRWESVFKPGKRLLVFNKKVIEAAYQTTTTLSANLIECATLGLADERLIQAVDFLALGKYHPSEIRSGLLSWGDSSGINALAGMVTAFLSV